MSDEKKVDEKNEEKKGLFGIKKDKPVMSMADAPAKKLEDKAKKMTEESAIALASDQEGKALANNPTMQKKHQSIMGQKPAGARKYFRSK